MAYVKTKEDQLLILKQVAFKGAIDLCCSGKIGFASIYLEAEEAYNWLKNPIPPKNLLGDNSG